MSAEQGLVLLKIAIALLAIMATYSLAGLVAVWGAQGRGHWFLRMVAVLAFPAAWLLTSDRRLCLFFISQMAVVVLRLWHLQSRHPLSGGRAGPAATGSQANESRRRYSLTELLLVFVLLCGVLAMLARMPPQVRWDWHLDVLPGLAMGMFTLVAIWAAQSQHSALLRGAALAVAFPALMMGIRLWLSRSVRGLIGRAAARLSLRKRSPGPSGDRGGFSPALSAGGPAAVGAATLFAVGPIATLLDAVLADEVGMRLAPDVGMQRFVVGRAGQKSVEHVFDVCPHVQVVADGAADQREEVGGPFAGGDAADEEPIFSTMQSSA